MRTAREWASRLSVRLLLLVTLAMAPALVLVVYTAIEQQRDAVQQAQENALRLGRSIAFEHQRWVNEIRSLLVSSSQIPLLREDETALCDRFLESLVARNDVYSTFHVVSSDGRYLCTSDPSAVTDDPLRQQWFQRAIETRDLAVGGYQVDSEGDASIVFAYPLLDPTGLEVTRVLAISVSLQWVNDRAAEADLPPASTLTVVDSNGTVLSRYPNPEQWVGVQAAEVPIVQTVLRLQTEGTARGIPGLEGTERVFGFVPFGAISGQQPLRILVGIPEDAVSERVEAALRRNLGGIGVALVLSLVAAWALSEVFVMRQVRALVAAAQRVAVGDFSARAQVQHDIAELGQVADAFDQMTTALREREVERAKAEEQRLELAREQTARAIAEAGHQRLRALVEVCSVGVFVVEASTRNILLANHEWRRIYGVPDAEQARPGHLTRPVYRRPDGSEYAYEDTPEMRALLKAESTTAEDMTIEFPDGRRLPVLVSATPLTDHAGNTEAAVVVLQDTSRLQELGQMRTEFLGMVSHELRTPLTIIKMAAASIASPDAAPSAAEVAEVAETIDQQADRLASLIDNLRDAVQIEAGAFSVSPEWEDILPVLRGAQQYIQRKANLAVSLRVSANIPRLFIDRPRVLQVMENLLNNAARYSAGDVPIRIDVSRTDAEVLVRVTNRGPGIPREKQPYLFRKFSQLSAGDRGQSAGGSGLGLAICKGIVEAHGGRIWVESAESAQDTTFAFALPLLQTEGASPDGEAPAQPTRSETGASA